MRKTHVCAVLSLALALHTVAHPRAERVPQQPVGLASAGQVPAQAPAPKSFCADCHLATTVPESRFHLVDWQRSIHARRGVMCESCHGGDAQSMDLMKAHMTVLPGSDPNSPVHPARQPATCGKCHARVLEQFRASRHATLLTNGQSMIVPTCASCHNTAAAELLNPDQVRVKCEQCHTVGKPAGHPEYPSVARMITLQYQAADRMLDAARDFIPLVPNPAVRATFEVDEARARTALATAADASHSMSYDVIDERLTVAFDRVAALVRRVLGTLPR